MLQQHYRSRPRYVVGPDGSALSTNDLPRSDTRGWTIMRKATVVAAVGGGLISLKEACSLYQLSTEEFLSWRRSIDRDGLRALRATRVQDYRK